MVKTFFFFFFNLHNHYILKNPKQLIENLFSQQKTVKISKLVNSLGHF